MKKKERKPGTRNETFISWTERNASLLRRVCIRRCIKNILIFRAEVKPVVAPVRIAINGDRCGMHNAYRLQLRAYLRKKLICVLAYPAIDFGHEFGDHDDARNKNKLNGLTDLSH